MAIFLYSNNELIPYTLGDILDNSVRAEFLVSDTETIFDVFIELPTGELEEYSLPYVTNINDQSYYSLPNKMFVSIDLGISGVDEETPTPTLTPSPTETPTETPTRTTSFTPTPSPTLTPTPSPTETQTPSGSPEPKLFPNDPITWFDASTHDAIILNEQNFITQFTDKSGNDNHAVFKASNVIGNGPVPGTQLLYEEVTPGLYSAQFANTNVFQFDLVPLSENKVTMIYVFKPNQVSNFSCFGSRMNTQNFDLHNGNTWMNYYRTVRQKVPGAQMTTNIAMMTIISDEVSNKFEVRRNGVSAYNSNDSNEDFTFRNDVKILGGDYYGKLYGHFCEVLFFDKTDYETIISAEMYLAEKWGVSYPSPTPSPTPSPSPTLPGQTFSTKAELQTAVDAWDADPISATETYGDISTWDVSAITHMSFLFAGKENITTLDLSGWDTSNVTDMSMMFSHCKFLTSLDISNFDTSNVGTFMKMFQACYRITSLDVSNFTLAQPSTSNVLQMEGLFYNCYSLNTIVGIENLFTGDILPNLCSTKNMFNGCYSLTSLNLSAWNTESFIDTSQMFAGMSDQGSIRNGFHLELEPGGNSNTDFLNTLDGGITSINLLNWDTSNVIDMTRMFCDCDKLVNLDVSSFTFENIQDATSTTTGGVTEMFKNCISLQDLDLSDWCVSNITWDSIYPSAFKPYAILYFSYSDINYYCAGKTINDVANGDYNYQTHGGCIGGLSAEQVPFANDPSNLPVWGTCPSS